MALDAFVALPLYQNATQTAFLSAVSSILRFHSATLQTLKASIQKRQRLDSGLSPTASTGRMQISIIETVLHTEDLQKQVIALAAMCSLDEETDPEMARENLPPGTNLLSKLYAELMEADNRTGPMIR